MEENRIGRFLVLTVSLVFAVFIIYYFWMSTTLEEIAYLPMYTVLLSFGYVLTQIVKRALFKKKNWWDWLYYIGLAAIVSPTFLVNEGNVNFFHILTDYGTFFLVIPIVLDVNKELRA